MSGIVVERQLTTERQAALGVRHWPVWSKEISVFPWTYPEQETCYLLEGEVIVTPNDGGEAVHLKTGDLAQFPAGLSCTWNILLPLKKHYSFD